jgi:hypothetical protein
MNSIGICGSSSHGAQRRRIGQRVQALAEGAIAYLVVVLEKSDECGRRQVRAGLATLAAAVRHQLALEGKALRQRPAQARGRPMVIGVVALGFPAGGHVQHVMHVVVPLGVVQR